MAVDAPKQNKHRWWGTLTIDQDTEVIGGTLAAGVQCVFVKTSRDAHFIAEGTYLKKVKVLSGKTAAEDAIRQKANSPNLDLSDLNSPDFPDFPIVEILEVDYEKTSPLTIELNILTQSLFRNKAWLEKYGSEMGTDDIGENDIKIGREMPPL